jgi:hypothetical protein
VRECALNLPNGIKHALLGHKTCILLLNRMKYISVLYFYYYDINTKNSTLKWQNKCNLFEGGGSFFSEFLLMENILSMKNNWMDFLEKVLGF